MELRKEPRYAVDCDVETLPVAGSPELIRAFGSLINISDGGACVLTGQAVKVSSLVPCNFHFSSLPVRIPVIAQVRWIQSLPSDPSEFRVGLSFLV